MHPQLEADTVAVCQLALCDVRLMRDANYPWLVLVPRRDAVELIDLGSEDQHQLMTEIAGVSHALRSVVPCDKLNVATLGNVVPQLHIHVIARRRDDPAWPKPVWGAVPAKPYQGDAAEQLVHLIAAALR